MNSSPNLTKVQLKALSFIFESTKELGSAPTLRELCQFMGYSSIGSAQDLITALRKKGFLTNPDRQAARAFTLSLMALKVLEVESTSRTGPVSRLKESLKESFSLPNFQLPQVFQIPLLGTIPAGNPLEAITQSDEMLTIPFDLVSKSKCAPQKVYALRAQGDSMEGAGIIEHDVLIVHHTQDYAEGKIVVAHLQHDATVKRLMRDQEGWYLKAENPRYRPIYAKSHPFEVSGVVIGLVRQIA